MISKNSDADSYVVDSEINPNLSSQQIDIITLKEFLVEKNKVGLIKIEAEGFEPEVLLGIDFKNINILGICIDCGPERQPDLSTTVVECSNILFEEDFVLREFNRARTGLFFVNKNYSDTLKNNHKAFIDEKM